MVGEDGLRTVLDACCGGGFRDKSIVACAMVFDDTEDEYGVRSLSSFVCLVRIS